MSVAKRVASLLKCSNHVSYKLNKMSMPSQSYSTHHLGFATIHILDPRIVELIVHEGVDITNSMMDIWYDFLKRNVQCPALVLINKLHDYSYTFHAQSRIGESNYVKAVALVTHNKNQELISANLKNMMRAMDEPPSWEIRTFIQRDEALSWLSYLAK
jgi:hypothetical protein